jgi:hypothetical protein
VNIACISVNILQRGYSKGGNLFLKKSNGFNEKIRLNGWGLLVSRFKDRMSLKKFKYPNILGVLSGL